MKRTRTFSQIVSLLITVALVMGWSSFLPPELGNIPKAQAAQITITSSLFSTFAEQNASPQTVFTTNLIGYAFYISETGDEPRYQKTTDGGATWAGEVDLGSDLNWGTIAVWYDQWTPGDFTGTKIYICAGESSTDDIWFKTLDTNGDTLSPSGTTWTSVAAGTAWVNTTGTGASITKSTDGNLFATCTSTGALDVYKSIDSGSNWSATSASIPVVGDFNQVLPIGGAGDIIMLNHNVSANQLRSNVYDEATDAWSGYSNRIAATENATYDGSYGAALNKFTGEVYVAINNNPAVSGGDIKTARVVSDGTTNVTWNNTTDVYTDIGTTGLQGTMAIDQHNGDLYSFYLRGTVGSSMNVYYKKSTDQGATWGAESGAINSTSGNIQQVYANMVSPYKIYACWEDTTAFDLFGVNYTDTGALDISDARMMLLFDGASIPAGWSSISNSAGDMLYQKFPRGGPNYGAWGGADTHDHTSTVTNVTNNTTSGPAGLIGTSFAIDGHNHTYIADSDAQSILPTYRELQVIQYDAGIPSGAEAIPANAIAIFDTATMPSGWTQYSAQDNYFVRGGADGESTGGASGSHTHAVSFTGGVDTITGIGTSGALAPSFSSRVHTHTASATTAAGDFLPVNIDIVLGKNGASAAAIPGGMIAMFSAAPGGSWVSKSASGEDFYQKYFESKTAYAKTGGGAATHTHDTSLTVTAASASTVLTDKTVGATGAAYDHTHVITTTYSTINNLPTYADVLVYKMPAYNPQARNFRWYADEEDITPGTAYAAENAPPSTIEMGKNVRLKLRINISNTGGAAEDNSRKKLQFSTDGAVWTDVGSTASSALWRYYNGGGNDNDTLPSVLLTDSNSTYRGIHNESSSDSPSGSDHPADTVVEFEYCIEGYDLTKGTKYNFRLYDQVSAAVIPNEAGGGGTPFITVDAGMDLTMSSPADIAFGTWDLGSGGYFSYPFATGSEEVTARDNRGLSGGASQGWTLSVEMTTPLYDASTIPASDMYWITNPITGLYDAPTANMSIESGSYMGSPVSAIVASATDYAGLGGYTILPTMRVYSAPGPGNYKGAITFTIA